jgi:hypothetical protein
LGVVEKELMGAAGFQVEVLVAVELVHGSVGPEEALFGRGADLGEGGFEVEGDGFGMGVEGMEAEDSLLPTDMERALILTHVLYSLDHLALFFHPPVNILFSFSRAHVLHFV